MRHDFATTPKIEAPRSLFDRSHGHKFTADCDWLIPYYWDECLPGDTFNYNCTIMARMNTPLFPIMDNIKLSTHFFFVPYRILWDNFRKFIGEQENPADSIDYTIPAMSGGTASDGHPDLTTLGGRRQYLLNIMGIPYGITPDDVSPSVLPFRAYTKIYDRWFRDQNLIDSLATPTGDGPDNITVYNYMLQKRGKRFDYITQSLPWPQKGDAVNLPLGTQAPITGFGILNEQASTALTSVAQTGQGHTAFTGWASKDSPASAGDAQFAVEEGTTGEPAVYADLTSATASTINDLREAFQIQKLLERDARSGTRFADVIRNHFNVEFYDVSSDPEFLGSGSQMINVTPVATTADSGTEDVGDLSGYSASVGSGHSFTKSFHEPGIVMGIMSIQGDITYQKGLRREFSRSTRYDFYWPSLAHLGEQELLSKELFVDGTANDEDVFGYVPRYDEYRHKLSQISGLFQSDDPASIDSWHLSQDFASRPVLGQTFIESETPLDRCVRVPSEPHFIIDTYADLKCARPIPTYGTPGMIDHF